MTIQRMNYFKGEILHAEDFQSEQQYHLSMRRFHNQHLHTWGIIEGLEVIPGIGKVTIKPGAAIDKNGNEIIVTNEVEVQITASCDIRIKYKEEDDPASKNSDTTFPGFKHKNEGYEITMTDPDAVALAKVTGVSASALVTFDPAFKPIYASPVAKGNMDIGGDLSVKGKLTVQGETTIVNTERMQGNVVLGDADTDTVTLEGSLVTGHSSGKLKLNSPVDIAGTLSTSGRLTANENVEVAGNLTVRGALTVQGETTLVNTERIQGNVVLGDADSDIVTLEGGLVTGHSSGKLKLNSPVDITGSLSTTGRLIANENVEVAGNLTVGGTLIVQGETTVVNTERMQGNVVLGDADTDTVTLEGILITGHSSGKLKLNSPVDIAGALNVTGSLTLPPNGLNVGTNQLALANGNVGIGTSGSGTNRLKVMGADDTINNYAFFAGGVSTTGLAVRNDGNVGIGTTAPGAKLEVKAGSENQTAPVEAIRIWGPNTPGNVNSGQELKWDFAAAGSAGIRAYRDTSWGTHLQFLTNAQGQGADSPQVRMHISENGNVGIGTINPKSNLEVAGGIASQGGRVRRDFLTWSITESNAIPVHIKTNIPWKSNVMYRILVEGYNYGQQAVINSDICGYTYQDWSNIGYAQANNYANGASISQYYSKDNYVVIKLTVSTVYYMGFSVSAWFTNPTGNAFDISAAVYHQADNL